MGYPVTLYESEGGHIWRNWRIYLTIFAQYLFQDFEPGSRALAAIRDLEQEEF
jgi:hypothetical protein